MPSDGCLDERARLRDKPNNSTLIYLFARLGNIGTTFANVCGALITTVAAGIVFVVALTGWAFDWNCEYRKRI